MTGRIKSHKKYKQRLRFLQFMEKIILGLVGEISSGKGTITKYLTDKYDASSYRFSTMLRDILDRLYMEQSRENMQKLSTMLRENFGEDALAKVMSEDAKKDDNKIIVIDGVRRLGDIKYLSQLPEFKLVFIKADIKKRYERIIKRQENPDEKNKTFEEFEKDHQGEADAKIKDLENHADVVINNDGDLEELHKQVDEIIK